MAQYDVHRLTDAHGAVLYLLDVQADCLEHLDLRVVVPLVAEKEIGSRISHLNPAFVIEGQSVLMSTAEIVGMSRRHLGPKVCSLADKRYDILAALDFIFTGV